MVSHGNWMVRCRIHDFTSDSEGSAMIPLVSWRWLMLNGVSILAQGAVWRIGHFGTPRSLPAYHFLRWKAGWIVFSASQVYTQTSFLWNPWTHPCLKKVPFSNQISSIQFCFDDGFLPRKGPCFGQKAPFHFGSFAVQFVHVHRDANRKATLSSTSWLISRCPRWCLGWVVFGLVDDSGVSIFRVSFEKQVTVPNIRVSLRLEEAVARQSVWFEVRRGGWTPAAWQNKCDHWRPPTPEHFSDSSTQFCSIPARLDITLESAVVLDVLLGTTSKNHLELGRYILRTPPEVLQRTIYRTPLHFDCKNHGFSRRSYWSSGNQPHGLPERFEHFSRWFPYIFLLIWQGGCFLHLFWWISLHIYIYVCIKRYR